MAINNILIGELDLTGIQAAPREQFQIEVTFESMLTLFSKFPPLKWALVSRKKSLLPTKADWLRKITVLFGDYDINAWSEEENKIKERIDARNSLDNYLYVIKINVDDPERLTNKLSEDD